MSKYSELIKTGKYPELEEYASNKGLLIGQDVEDDLYVFTLMSEDSNNGNELMLNGTISEDTVQVFIIDDNSEVVETLDQKYDTDSEEELFETIKSLIVTYEILNDIGLDSHNVDEVPEDGEILNEEKYTSLEDGLKDVQDRVKSISRTLKQLSQMSEDEEIVALVSDIANSADALSVDMDEALDMCTDIVENP